MAENTEKKVLISVEVLDNFIAAKKNVLFINVKDTIFESKSQLERSWSRVQVFESREETSRKQLVRIY